MPETGGQADSHAGPQRHFKPWIPNRMLGEHCLMHTLGIEEEFEVRLSLALLSDFLIYSKEGSNCMIYGCEEG